jgi:hypothetical protein
LTENPTEQVLASTILRIVTEKKPATVQDLVKLVKEATHTSDKQILGQIVKLQNEGKLLLTQQPQQTPTKLATYVKSSQTLWYWITLALTVATVIVVFTISEDQIPLVYIRYVLGTIFILWLPGYTFIKALFPTQLPIKTTDKDLDNIERIALSLGMSLALVPIVGLLLNYTPWGIRLTPITLSLVALTMIFATTALLRENQNHKKQASTQT